MSEITLSAGVRSNLLSLQNTAGLMEQTQTRLATGKKVNSALDNPTNFFTAQSLHARSKDLSGLLDSMSNAIKTLEAADNGISSITNIVESMQATARQARSDNTPGVFTAHETAELTLDLDGNAEEDLTFTIDGNEVRIDVEGMSLEDIAEEINTHGDLDGKVRAIYDDGDFTLENLTTEDIAVTGIDGTEITGADADDFTLEGGSVGLSETRASLMNQFNALRDQLDEIAQDSGFNGINLLNGDELRVIFNETSTSEIRIKGKDSEGEDFGALTSDRLGINAADDSNFGADTALDSLDESLRDALTTLRSQAAQYGSNLTVVETRQDFTKSMMNTLQTGADNLVLADTNEEGANMLALQTRQQLSSVALSLASQADQNVLRLF